jgi:hypothetical protein
MQGRCVRIVHRRLYHTEFTGRRCRCVSSAHIAKHVSLPLASRFSAFFVPVVVLAFLSLRVCTTVGVVMASGRVLLLPVGPATSTNASGSKLR